MGNDLNGGRSVFTCIFMALAPCREDVHSARVILYILRPKHGIYPCKAIASCSSSAAASRPTSPLELIRRLRERGVVTRTILTDAGTQFVTPLSVSALSGEKTYQNLFSLTDEAEMGHIQLSRAADLVVVAPATADLMAKLANGHANDLASTALLATDKRVLMAPAMNVRMWNHPATQRNLKRLKDDGVIFVGPNDGEMACGEFGPGRMAEPNEIVGAIEAALAQPSALTGMRALVTAGPTHEPLDPVRFIANRSSGKQGYAIADALARAGAETVLVSGPVEIAPPPRVKLLRVETAREMLAACESVLPVDVAVCAAAVGDWRPEIAANHKIKKRENGAAPALSRSPPIPTFYIRSRIRRNGLRLLSVLRRKRKTLWRMRKTNARAKAATGLLRTM